MTTTFVIRGPLYTTPQPMSWISNMYLRPIASVGGATTPQPTNIYYRPLQPTVGHLGFLGLY